MQIPGRTGHRVAQDVVSRTDPPRNAPPAGQDTSRRLTGVEPDAALTACSRRSPGMADPVGASFAGNPQNQRPGSARVAGQPPILREGETCWRRELAHRFAVLIDGDSYFRALRSAMIRAERSIMVLAWEFHARTNLCPGGDPGDGWPTCLVDPLLEAVRRKPLLEVRILAWDHPVLFALEREFLPALTLPGTAIRDSTFGSTPPIRPRHRTIRRSLRSMTGSCSAAAWT
jgi:hypothetical protein